MLDNRYRAAPRSVQLVESRKDVELVEGDVRYPAMVQQAMRGVEAVVHLAAVCINKSVAAPAESLDVNLLGTQHVLDAAAAHGVRRIVFASSASVYGNSPTLPMAEQDSPASPDAVLRGQAGRGAAARLPRRSRSSMEWNALRLFNVYGPGQPTDAYYTSVIVTFLTRLMKGLPPEIDGAGDQTMDFVHVADVARAFGMALDCVGERSRAQRRDRATRPPSPTWPRCSSRPPGRTSSRCSGPVRCWSTGGRRPPLPSRRCSGGRRASRSRRVSLSS